MNNGKDRQTMMMCMNQCHHDYEQERYKLLGSGKPTGDVAITVRTRVEDLVMTTLGKMHATDDNNDGGLFHDTVALVREYFTTKGQGQYLVTKDYVHCAIRRLKNWMSKERQQVLLLFNDYYHYLVFFCCYVGAASLTLQHHTFSHLKLQLSQTIS
jgi:hypothetical protein